MTIIIPFPKTHRDFTYFSDECRVCNNVLTGDEPTYEIVDHEHLTIYYVCESCTIAMFRPVREEKVQEK